jgi:uncharacterized protein (TIGR03083 family)
MDPLQTDPTVADLIDIWQEALESVADLADSLTDDQWQAITPCPGWTVADVVSHLVDLEQFLAGVPRPDHEPDWATLPHASSDFGRFTEVGVDYRRGRPRDEVVTELREAIAARRPQLDAVPEGAQVPGIMGRPITMDRLLRMRIFDSWVHEQDIRAAVGRDGGWGTRPAIIAFQQAAKAVPVVWSRTVKAQPGDTVHLSVTGPELVAEIYADVDETGRGRACAPVADPAVSLTVSWPDLMRLANGRIALDDAPLRSRLVLTGKPELADALLPALSIAP